jgi:hypothetical protein
LQDIIAQDTKWAIDNLPYLLTENIQVTYGATLTIESGVMVVGNNYKLQIFGNLVPLIRINSIMQANFHHCNDSRCYGGLSSISSEPKTGFSTVYSIELGVA